MSLKKVSDWRRALTDNRRTRDIDDKDHHQEPPVKGVPFSSGLERFPDHDALAADTNWI